ncbi:hypothetical protein BpHYR1_017478 [Brachionus plicatilis]|uniref:Uncharacterized protein n=1 Tax=Brachionus plicatilis TaxID=10195 RepID=A0A3M7PKJ5_BRAPC|nr:hypothetical protein BpHYR1_017478 [Brachionus plicatilis]
MFNIYERSLKFDLKSAYGTKANFKREFLSSIIVNPNLSWYTRPFAINAYASFKSCLKVHLNAKFDEISKDKD